MIKDVATTLYSFFNSFGIPGYVSNYVDESTEFPYLTYELPVGKTLQTTPVSVRLFYSGDLPTAMFETTEAIYKKIQNGLQLPCGNGFLYIMPGNPFAQVTENDEPTISAMYLNINISYDLN